MPDARVFMMVSVTVSVTDQDGKETRCQGSSSNSFHGDDYPDVAVIRQLVQGHMAASENVAIKQVARLYAEKDLAPNPLQQPRVFYTGELDVSKITDLGAPYTRLDKLVVIDDEMEGADELEPGA